jgi:hypothetical protein
MSGLPERRTDFAEDCSIACVRDFLASLFCHSTELFFIVFRQLRRDFDFDGDEQVTSSSSPPF